MRGELLVVERAAAARGVLEDVAALVLCLGESVVDADAGGEEGVPVGLLDLGDDGSVQGGVAAIDPCDCLLYTSPSPRD